MKHSLLILALFLSFAGVSRAHGVSVFAFVDGDVIQVECGFSKSRRVVGGKLEITDIETKETIVQGTTDGEGVFRFRPSDAFLATGHGLNIRLFAGEGHQDDWKITPDELRALFRPAPPPSGNQTASLSAVDMPGLEAMIGRVVEEKIAPLKQAMERQRRDDGEPRLRDVFGGIGWIVGILGLIAYRKYRKTLTRK